MRTVWCWVRPRHGGQTAASRCLHAPRRARTPRDADQSTRSRSSPPPARRVPPPVAARCSTAQRGAGNESADNPDRVNAGLRINNDVRKTITWRCSPRNQDWLQQIGHQRLTTVGLGVSCSRDESRRRCDTVHTHGPPSKERRGSANFPLLLLTEGRTLSVMSLAASVLSTAALSQERVHVRVSQVQFRTTLPASLFADWGTLGGKSPACLCGCEQSQLAVPPAA